MLSALKFVMGSIAKKDLVPALTSFVIENGTVRGYNGTLALCSPIPFDIACKPKAETLIRAIKNCVDTVTLRMTPAGRLAVQSGQFKAFIECIEGETAHVQPEGQFIELDGQSLLQALKVLEPFIGTDASRAWSHGVLLRGQSAFATCNVILAEYWTGFNVPATINLPRDAVREVLRIGEAPTRVQMTENSMTFHYESGRWIRTQLLSTEWPDLSKVLDREPGEQAALPQGFFDAVETIKPFCDKAGRVLFKGSGVIATSHTEGEGSSYTIEGFDHTGVFNVEMLMLLKGCASTVNFSAYPNPCMFFGDRLRGAIMGMRDNVPGSTNA